MGLKNLKTSEKLETSGIWLEVENNRIKLARAGGSNKKYEMAMERFARKYGKALNMISETVGRKFFHETYAETIILDWLYADENGDLNEEGRDYAQESLERKTRWSRGINIDDENILTFEPENVVKVLNEFSPMFPLMKEVAEDFNNYKSSLVEGIVGN